MQRVVRRRRASSASAGAVAERSARRRQDQPPDLAAVAAVQALVNRVVLAVDRQDGDAAPARGGDDQRAGHHEHFLVRERDGLAALDRRQHRLEAGGAGRGAEHDVDVGMRGDRNEAVAPPPGRSEPQARFEPSAPPPVATPTTSRAVPRNLFGEPRRVLAGGQRRRRAADPDARRRPRARSVRSIRSNRESRGASRQRPCKHTIEDRRREQQASMRSRTPPWPGNQRRAVLHARARFRRDSNRSPAIPRTRRPVRGSTRRRSAVLGTRREAMP